MAPSAEGTAFPRKKSHNIAADKSDNDQDKIMVLDVWGKASEKCSKNLVSKSTALEVLFLLYGSFLTIEGFQTPVGSGSRQDREEGASRGGEPSLSCTSASAKYCEKLMVLNGVSG